MYEMPRWWNEEKQKKKAVSFHHGWNKNGTSIFILYR